MSVLLLPPIFQFFDDNGDPLAGGKVYTYAAGTTTPLVTYTSNTGLIAAPNPIQLDAAGRPESGSGAIWGEGAYKFIVQNSLGVQVGDVLDNVTSFTTLAGAANAYMQSFSGNGVQTVFTTSDNLGDEEKGLMVFVDNGSPNIATNGTFATDTDWTKGAGWTIGAGVATATGAISTAISQTSSITLVEGLAYSVTYTITASAGSLTASIGGQNGTARTVSGTYREVIIAGSSQTIAFTGAGFTGTLDTVVISLANSKGYEILNPSAYTINGTSLTFASAPKTGVNNIYVFAPSLLLGAASSAAALAQTYATNALASQVAAAASAASAAAWAAKNKWNFSTTTTMADPATANVRLNNAALVSVTQIAISDLSANAGNPNIGNWIATWDDAGGTNRGSIFIFKDESNFAIYNVNSASTDNTTWFQLPVTYVTHSGSFSNLDVLYFGFAASGTTTVTGGITALTGDVTASGAGSVAATIANNAVTTAKINNDAVTLAKIQNAGANSVLLGSGASGSGADYSEITLGTNLSMSGSVLNAAGGKVVAMTTTGTIATSSSASTIPLDSSKVQNTEGFEVQTHTHTPASASNILRIDTITYLDTDSVAAMSAALFQDSIADCLIAGIANGNGASNASPIVLTHFMTAGTTSAITFKVRCGSSSGTTYFNSPSGGQTLGGLSSRITVTELTP